LDQGVRGDLNGDGIQDAVVLLVYWRGGSGVFDYLAAVAACGKKGYKVSAAVVDRSGVIQSQMRGDGAGVHTIDSSRRKAYTAASMGRPTQKFAELVGKHPDLHALGGMNNSILLLGGGFPIRIDGQIVGGLGVGGAPAHIWMKLAPAPV